MTSCYESILQVSMAKVKDYLTTIVESTWSFVIDEFLKYLNRFFNSILKFFYNLHALTITDLKFHI